MRTGEHSYRQRLVVLAVVWGVSFADLHFVDTLTFVAATVVALACALGFVVAAEALSRRRLARFARRWRPVYATPACADHDPVPLMNGAVMWCPSCNTREEAKDETFLVDGDAGGEA